MLIGLDIGGSYIRGIAWKNNLLRGEYMQIPKNKAKFERILLEMVSDLAVGQKIEGIGVGIAGPTDGKKIILSTNNKFLQGYKLTEYLKKNFKAPVLMDNDARCFLRAELKLGAARGFSSAVGVTVGTGLGGSLSLKGEIITGHHYIAGELGHIKTDSSEWEDLASSKFRKIHGDNFKVLGKNLGDVLANICFFFDPEIIVLGGGLITKNKFAEKVTLPAAKKQLKIRLKELPSKKVKVVTSSLGEFAGSVGAALLFEKQERS